VAAAVLLPAGLVRFRAEGRLLALADDDDAIGGDAELDEIRLDRGGAALAEREVVLRGAALVASPSMLMRVLPSAGQVAFAVNATLSSSLIDGRMVGVGERRSS
jgi:hypothetical protein